MKNVQLEIRSLQNGKEVSYVYTHGKMLRTREGAVYLEFDGTGLLGEEGVTVRLCVSDRDKLVFSAGKGKNVNTFVFENGVKNHCNFDLDDEYSVVGIDPRSIEAHVGKTGGDILLRYVIDFNRIPPVMNEIKIRVRGEQADPGGLDAFFEHRKDLRS